MDAEHEGMRFHDRCDAGRQLAERLGEYRGRADTIVLGLPRGGVPVAYEVAASLALPLDVFLVRKLGVPGREELAMGAIASGGVRVVDSGLTAALGIDEARIDAVAAEEQRRLEERERRYRDERPAPAVEDKTVLLIDDGLATGASMLAAVKAIRSLGPAKVIVAVPTAPPETCARLGEEAEDVICAITPDPFYAVGLWYQRFGQVSDDQVCELLERAHREHGPAPVAGGAPED